MIRFVLPRPSKPPPRRSNADPRRGQRAARQLALAYAVERWIEDGTLRDHAHAAELLGISRPRMSQIAGLRYLAPSIQRRILDGEELHERALRRACTFADWEEQRAAIERYEHDYQDRVRENRRTPGQDRRHPRSR